MVDVVNKRVSALVKTWFYIYRQRLCRTSCQRRCRRAHCGCHRCRCRRPVRRGPPSHSQRPGSHWPRVQTSPGGGPASWWASLCQSLPYWLPAWVIEWFHKQMGHLFSDLQVWNCFFSHSIFYLQGRTLCVPSLWTVQRVLSVDRMLWTLAPPSESRWDPRLWAESWMSLASPSTRGAPSLRSSEFII